MQVYKKMEEHEHTNDFVVATFACDLYKMKMLIALGKRMCFFFTCDKIYVVATSFKNLCWFSKTGAQLII